MAAAPGDTPVIYGSASPAGAAGAGADGRGDGADPADSDASWRAARVDRDTTLPLVSPVQSYGAFFQTTPDLFFCRCVMKVNKNQKRQKRMIAVKRGHIVVIDPSKSVIRRYLPVANIAGMRRRRISGQGDGGEGTVWQCLLVVPAEFDLLLNFSRDDSNLPLDPGRRPEHFFHVLRTLHDRLPPPKSMHYDVVVPSTEDLFRQANFEKPEGYQSPLPRLEEMERIIRSRSLQPGGGSGATPLQPPQAGREASLSSLSAPSDRPRTFDPPPHTLAGWRRGSVSPAVSSPQSSPKRSRESKSPKRGRSIDAGSGVPREELTRILEEKVQDWNHAIEDENVQLKLKMLELSETVNQLSHKNASAESEVAELRDVVGKLTEELLRARERQVCDGTPRSTDGNGVAGATPPATLPVSTAASATAAAHTAALRASPPPTPPLPPVLPKATSQQQQRSGSGSGRGGSAAATPPLGPSAAPAAAAAAPGTGTAARKDFIYPPEDGPPPRVGNSTPSFASPASPPDGGVYFAGDLYQKVLPAGGSVPCSPAVAAARPRVPRPLGELPHCLTGEEVRALARQSIRYVECLQHATLADLREVLPLPAVRKLLAATGYKPGGTPEAPLVEAGAGVLGAVVGGAGSSLFPSAGVAGLHARAPPASAALPAVAVTGQSGSGVVEDNANLRAMVDFLRSQIVYLDCVQQGTAEGETGGSSGAASAAKPPSIVRKL